MRWVKNFTLKTGFIVFAVVSTVTLANAKSLPELRTNQQYIEETSQRTNLRLDDTRSVFEFVFNSLPDKVKVYPTENYYYFSFYQGGVKYAGNLRLDAFDRDKGVIHFAYFNAFTRWNEEITNSYKPMNVKDGIIIKKLDELIYRVSFKGKSVVFELNDLRSVVLPDTKTHSQEKYIGPVYDESGLQFLLVYNSKARLFHYILNDAASVPEQFSVSRSSPEIIIGARTGFAFYHDKLLDRKILVGVYEGNSMVNNYFDGPFDQLPDNFIKDDQLKKALIDETPELAGTIDRFGNTDKQGTNRVLIGPYMHYQYESDLVGFAQCATAAGKDRVVYYACFKATNLEHLKETK